MDGKAERIDGVLLFYKKVAKNFWVWMGGLGYKKARMDYRRELDLWRVCSL